METHGSYQNLLIQIKHSMCAWSSIHYLSLDLYYHNSICQSNISYSILYIYLRRIWITPIIKRKKCCFCGWLWPDACTFLHLAFAKMENSVRSESCVIRHHDVYEVSKDQKKDKHKTRINKETRLHMRHDCLVNAAQCETIRARLEYDEASEESECLLYIDTKINVVALAAKRSFKWISPVFPRFPWQLRSVVWRVILCDDRQRW